MEPHTAPHYGSFADRAEADRLELPEDASSGHSQVSRGRRLKAVALTITAMSLAVVGYRSGGIRGSMALELDQNIASTQPEQISKNDGTSAATNPDEAYSTGTHKTYSSATAKGDDGPPSDPVPPSQSGGLRTVPHDPNAIPQTRALLTALHDLKGQQAMLFGHQEDNVHGQHWQDRTGDKPWMSDIANSTGSYPGVFGYSFQSVDDDDWGYLEPMRFAYEEQGAIIEILWAAYNPVTLGNENNLTMNACQEVVPGGSANDVWTGWLDSMAKALHNMTDSTGAQMPAILRIFHENTGNWYWWGTDWCNATDYKAMWYGQLPRTTYPPERIVPRLLLT